MGSFSVSPTWLSRVMIFIDGGYLRKQVSEISDGEINYRKLAEILTVHTQRGDSKSQLIRAYYYDAIPILKERMSLPDDMEDQVAVLDEMSNVRVKQDEYIEKIKMIDLFDVRLGELVWSELGKYRQKGVDSLIAIDMITKAYQNQYDEAVLVAGDSDFIEIVKAVKSVGPRVTGAYFEKNTRPELINEFDKRYPLRKGGLIKNSIIKE